MKKTKLILATLLVCSSLGIEVGLTPANVNAKSNYPNISRKFDTDNMNQYSNSDLFADVTLKNFYVQTISYDKHHVERAIITDNPQSKDYYLVVLNSSKHNKKMAVGDSITIKGQLNGRTTIDKSPANSWFAHEYIGKKAILVLPDSYR